MTAQQTPQYQAREKALKDAQKSIADIIIQIDANSKQITEYKASNGRWNSHIAWQRGRKKRLRDEAAISNAFQQISENNEQIERLTSENSALKVEQKNLEAFVTSLQNAQEAFVASYNETLASGATFEEAQEAAQNTAVMVEAQDPTPFFKTPAGIAIIVVVVLAVAFFAYKYFKKKK